MCIPVNKCCFCGSLETGAKIIGVLSVVCSMATAVVYAGAAMSLSASAQTKQCFYLIATTVAVCHMVFGCLLVYGVIWKKPSYLWPWLVTSWISCGILFLLSLLGVILLTIQYYENMETFADISAMSTVYFVYAVILYYCVTVVQSRRVQLLRAEETESADKLMGRQDIPKAVLV